MSLSHTTTSRIDVRVALAMPGVQIDKAWDSCGVAGTGYSGRFDNQLVLPPS